MPNPIKYSTGSESLSLKKGNFYIGTGDVGKGPSETTGFYQGPSPSEGGYIVYMNRDGAPGNLSYHNAPTDNDFITFTNNLAGQSYTTVQECLVYYAGQTDKVCLNRDYESIITDGLVLNVDAGFTPSYPTSNTTWYDLSSGGYNLTLINGPTYSNGAIYISGTDDEISNDNFIAFNNNPWSICGWLYYQNVIGNQGLVWGSFPSGGSRLFSGPNVETQWGSVDSFYVDLLWSNTSHRFTTGTAVMRRNDWNFVSITYNAGTLKIYLDGNEKASQLINPTNQNFWVDDRIQIGRTTTNNAYIGGIATTQIYNRALSADEILQNYNAQKGRFGL